MSTDKNSKIKVDDEEDIESNEFQESRLRTFIDRERKDISSSNFWRAVFAEFLGTYMLMFWTIGMGRYNPETESAPDLLLIAIGTGFTVACIINALVNVSGGHVNPALSIGFLIRGDITFLKFVFCVVVQCLASACAVMTLCQLVPPEKHGDLGLLLPGPGVNSFQALIAEFWITFGLLFVTNAFIDDKRSDVTDPIPFYVGMIVAANILFTAGISGGCMNPARNFGPAVVTGQFEKQWLYWVGPLLGAAVATLLYNKWFSAQAMEGSLLSPCICNHKRQGRPHKGGDTTNEREQMLTTEA